MERGKEQGMMVPKLMPQQNPLELLNDKYNELDNRIKAWLAKQSLPVEVAVVTTTSAAFGAFMGILTNDISTSLPTTPQASLNPQAMASVKQAPVSSFFLAFILICNLGSIRRPLGTSSQRCRDDRCQCWSIFCYEKIEREGGCPI
ncbi:hypothetical protein DITRI_Ditri04bG0153700 [Diplodiscus trichospermus]